MPLSTLTQLRIDVDALALETGNMTETERAKLADIEEGATANATNAQLRDRSTHTGTQASSSVVGLPGSAAYPFASRAEAMAATIPTGQDTIAWYDHGVLLKGARDPSGTALTTNGGAVSWRPAGLIDVTPEHFGAVGDGVANDTPAFVLAASFLSANGGGVLSVSRKYLIDANLTIPDFVVIQGPNISPGQSRPDLLYNDMAGQLVLNSLATISCQDRAGIVGCVIIRKGLTLPFADATAAAAGIAAFSGTAVTVAGPDVSVRDCLFLGFNRAIDSDLHERILAVNVKGDCTNGIRVRRCYDIARLVDCHFWPFTTVHQSWTTPDLLTRSGTAFEYRDRVDWGKMTGCFTYGYAIGYDVNGCESVTLTGCGADHDPSSSAALTSIGFYLRGAAVNTTMTATQSAAGNRGIVVNTTSATRNSHRIIGHSNWTTKTAAAEVISGSVAFEGMSHSGGTGSVFILHNGTNGSIIGGNFRDIAVGVSTPTSWDWRGGGASWKVIGNQSRGAPAPSDLAIDSHGPSEIWSASANDIPVGSTVASGEITEQQAIDNNWPTIAGAVTTDPRWFVLTCEGQSSRIVQTATEVFGSGGRKGRTYRRVKQDAAWSAWTITYSPSTIVGTVSQSGGVPTGALVEKGSNGNGVWRRFADGSQECWLTTVSSGVAQTWTYPVPFAGVLMTMASPRGVTALRSGQTASVTNSDLSYAVFDKNDALVSGVNVTLYARGTWY